MSELLTTAEVAERLRVCDETVRRWCRIGRLRTVRVGRRHLISSSELARFTGEAATVELPTPPRRETWPGESAPLPRQPLTPRIIG